MHTAGDSVRGQQFESRRLFEAEVTGGANGWHVCTCKDGTTYECKSKLGDGAACCGRSMPAICGEGNVDHTVSLSTDIMTFEPQMKVTGGEDDWVTCTCPDETTYQCKNKNGGMHQGCCTRSMPAICAPVDKFTTLITKGSRSAGDTIAMNERWGLSQSQIDSGGEAGRRLGEAGVTGGENGWHVCTCKDGKHDLSRCPPCCIALYRHC